MKKIQLVVIIGIFATINILGLGLIYFKANKQNQEKNDITSIIKNSKEDENNQIANYNSSYLEKNEPKNNTKQTKNNDSSNNLSKDEKTIKNIISIYTDSLINKDFKKAYSFLTDKSKKNISYQEV